MPRPPRRERREVSLRERWVDADADGRSLAVLPNVVLVASTSAILVEISSAPSAVKVTYRLLFATLGFLPISLIWYRDHFRRFGRRDLVLAGVAGVVLGVHYLLWFESLEWTTVAASTTLAQTQTIFVTLLAWVLLGERISRVTATGIGFALTGVVVMSTGGLVGASLLRGVNPMYGNFLATLSGILFAVYLVVGRALRQRIAAIPFVTVVHLFAAVTALALTAANGTSVALTDYPRHEWVLFLAMGFGPSFVAQSLTNWTLKYLPSNVVSVAFLGVPVTSSVLALIVFGEVPGLATLAGGTVVLVGIYVTIRA